MCAVFPCKSFSSTQSMCISNYGNKFLFSISDLVCDADGAALFNRPLVVLLFHDLEFVTEETGWNYSAAEKK